MMRYSTMFAAIIVLTAACSGSEGAGNGSWQAVQEVRGDTVVVRTVAGQVWQAPRDAVVELSIGSLDGPEETMFGQIAAMAVDDVGGVYVYDAQAPAIRYFDATGQFVRQVGRDGEGPGEYRDAVLGMALRSDGGLQIRDARNGRVTVYNPDGSYADQWIVASGLFTSQAMLLDRDDHSYLKALEREPRQGEPWRIGLLHYDAVGRFLDTIPEPWVANPPSGGGFLSPAKQWTLARNGSIVVGVNDVYRFEIRRRDGHVIRIEREVSPLRLTDAEHAAYEERREYQIRTQGRFMTTLPDETRWTKPVYRALFTDPTDRVWVHLYGAVEPKASYEPAAEGQPPTWPFVERKIYDVFEGDGTYLGQVRVPHDVDVEIFGEEVLWGVRSGELGEHYAVRLRLEAGAE